MVVDVSRALVHYLGRWGFALFTLLGLGLALLPLVDRGPERELRRRPVAAAIGLIFFLGFLGFWMAGRGLRTVPTAPPAVEPPAAVAPAVALPGSDSPGTEGGKR